MSSQAQTTLDEAAALKSKGRHELAERLLADFMAQNKDQAAIQRAVGLMFKEEFVDKRLQSLAKGAKNSHRVQQDIHRHRRLAETAFRTSLMHEPDNIETLLGLANLYADWERRGEAFEHVRKAIEIEPYNAEAWWLLSDIYEKVNQHEYSEICMKNALCIGNEDFGNVRRGYVEPARGIVID